MVAGVAAHEAPRPLRDQHVTISLIAEHAKLVPGATTLIGVRFEVEPDWHIYWNGWNDTGFPPSPVIQAPPGFKVGPLQWPAPSRYVSPGDILDHVYENEVVLLAPVEVPLTAPPGQVTLSVSSKWLVCHEACVPESGGNSLKIDVAPSGTAPEPSSNAKLIASNKARVPVPLPISQATQAAGQPASSPTVSIEKQSLVAHVSGATRLEFFPAANSVACVDLLNEGSAKGDRLALRLSPEKLAEKNARVRGVLAVSNSPGNREVFYSLDIPAQTLAGASGEATPAQQPSPVPADRHTK